MHHTKTAKATWIAAAAGLAGITAYLVSDRLRVGMHMSHDTPWGSRELVLDRTQELARFDMTKAAAGAGALAFGAWLATALIRRQQPTYAHSGHRELPSVVETLDVEVPVSVAYNQWTQFEEFPRFMATVESVKQIDDEHLHWRANVAGKPVEWDAEITEQIPDERIAWRSTSGPQNRGLVTFNKVADNRTRVTLEMFYEPQSRKEKIGSALGGVKLTAKANLAKFKQLVEARGVETGSWRGEIGTQH